LEKGDRRIGGVGRKGLKKTKKFLPRQESRAGKGQNENL